MSTAIKSTEPSHYHTLWASIHDDLITLASTDDEHAYLLRRVRKRLQILGPIPRKEWLDWKDATRLVLEGSKLDALGLTWQPCPDPNALDAHPSGVWYVPQDGSKGVRYVTHMQGFYDALRAFVRSPAGNRNRAKNYTLGRVPAVVLYPDGRYELVADASRLPMVLPLEAEVDADALKEQLDWDVQERVSPPRM